jgi:hypothetical protein
MNKTLAEIVPDTDLTQLTADEFAQITTEADDAERVWSRYDKPAFTELAVGMVVRGAYRLIIDARNANRASQDDLVEAHS